MTELANEKWVDYCVLTCVRWCRALHVCRGSSFYSVFHGSNLRGAWVYVSVTPRMWALLIIVHRRSSIDTAFSIGADHVNRWVQRLIPGISLGLNSCASFLLWLHDSNQSYALLLCRLGCLTAMKFLCWPLSLMANRCFVILHSYMEAFSIILLFLAVSIF